MPPAARAPYAEQRFAHLEGLDGISDDQIGEHLNVDWPVVERRLVEPKAIRPAAAA